MTEYFCAGYVCLKGNKKGIEYIEYTEDGKLNDENTIITTPTGVWDNPIGWIIKIEKGEKKITFKGVVQRDNIIPNEKVDEYRANSVAAVKRIELERRRSKGKSLWGSIENMSLKSLKKACDEDWQTKRLVKLYLLERF